MTERFKQLIVCECGHEGFVRLLESDWRRHEQYWLDVLPAVRSLSLVARTSLPTSFWP